MVREVRKNKPKDCSSIHGRPVNLRFLYKGEYFTTVRSPSRVAEVFYIHRVFKAGDNYTHFAKSMNTGALIEWRNPTDNVFEYHPTKEEEMLWIPYTA